MISKEQIRTALSKIAENQNLQGESINLLINQLTYALFHEQLEITNAIQESNLSTAYLMNSKIRNCMNSMYSVFRGRNARVNLIFKNNTHIKKSKFDVLFSSNTFKVYASEPFDLIQKYIEGKSTIKDDHIIGILAKKDLYDHTIQVTEDNKYYIDFIIDKKVINNLSEDIQIFINGKEYPITRNFYDHIQQVLPLKDHDAYEIGNQVYYLEKYDWKSVDKSDIKDLGFKLNILGNLSSKTQLQKVTDNDLDALFVLTLPDYGIRIYKRGYFTPSDEVRIRALQYCTAAEINSDEFSKIILPGTFMDTLPNKDIIVTKHNLEKSVGLIPEVERENGKSLLYTANLYERLQAQILSKSDINALFNEFFIEIVRSSINKYDDSTKTSDFNDAMNNLKKFVDEYKSKVKPDGTVDNAIVKDLVTSSEKLIKINKVGEVSRSFNDGYLYIFYVPKIDLDTVSDSMVDRFKEKYGSYFITKNITPVLSQLCTVNVSLTVYLTESVEITDQIEKIFSQYEYQLNDPNDLTYTLTSGDKKNVIKFKQIFSDISKLDKVDFIDNLVYSGYQFGNGEYVELDSEKDIPVNSPTLVGEVEVLVPTYYKFKLDINYKMSYENIS